MLKAGKPWLPIRAGGGKALHWCPEDSRDIHVTFRFYYGVLHQLLGLFKIINVMINVITLHDFNICRLDLTI